MAERTPRKLDKINLGRNEELKRLLNNPEIRRFFTDQITEIMGPLTVRGRWELLEKLGLKSIRAHIVLEGSAYVVASGIVNYTFQLGYPLTVSVLQAISINPGLGHYENLLQPFLEEFTEDKR